MTRRHKKKFFQSVTLTKERLLYNKSFVRKVKEQFWRGASVAVIYVNKLRLYSSRQCNRPLAVFLLKVSTNSGNMERN